VFVEPVTVGVVVAALAAKAAGRAADATVDAGEGVLRRLVDRVRARFAGAGDADAARVLELVEEVPDSEQLRGRLAEAVDRHAGADSAFAGELDALVGEARQGGVNVEQITQSAWGDGNVQIGGVADSQITIDGGDRAPPSPTS
jgi:hypothetical protein